MHTDATTGGCEGVLYETTTLAATAAAMIEAVEAYGGDAQAVFRRAGLDMEAVFQPGARYPGRAAYPLWQEAIKETGDRGIGLAVGERIRPQALHALGLSWLSSPTLLDGMRRIKRYCRIVNTSFRIEILEGDEQTQYVHDFFPEQMRIDESSDASLSAVINMCRLMAGPDFAPARVTFRHGEGGQGQRFEDYFNAPVQFSADNDALYFDAKVIAERLPAGNRVLADEVDRIAERYLATLNPEQIHDKVRAILLSLLPSGDASQENVARQLNRSVSSLQRQLKTEGYGYREILEETRQVLAAQLLRERRYSLSQIAYLLGFSDQANFSRAFKRWTGKTPRRFRRHSSGRLAATEMLQSDEPEDYRQEKAR
jgi:AraC-like DNA-binding protein